MSGVQGGRAHHLVKQLLIAREQAGRRRREVVVEVKEADKKPTSLRPAHGGGDYGPGREGTMGKKQADIDKSKKLKKVGRLL
jgi:hypothetical protein